MRLLNLNAPCFLFPTVSGISLESGSDCQGGMDDDIFLKTCSKGNGAIHTRNV